MYSLSVVPPALGTWRKRRTGAPSSFSGAAGAAGAVAAAAGGVWSAPFTSRASQPANGIATSGRRASRSRWPSSTPTTPCTRIPWTDAANEYRGPSHAPSTFE